MSSLLVFKILYTGHTFSNVGIFDRLRELLHYNLLSAIPPPPRDSKYTAYSYTVCKGGGVWGHRRGGGLGQIKHLPQSPITGQFF